MRHDLLVHLIRRENERRAAHHSPLRPLAIACDCKVVCRKALRVEVPSRATLDGAGHGAEHATLQCIPIERKAESLTATVAAKDGLDMCHDSSNVLCYRC